jgi:hypothetical protein
VSYEAVVNLIGSTRTGSGLEVKAMLDTRTYDGPALSSPLRCTRLNTGFDEL